MAREQVTVKHLPAIQNFGTVDVLCSDKTGTLTTGEMVLTQVIDPFGAQSDHPLLLGYLNSRFETGIRSPLDVAILKNERHDTDGYVKCDEIPFDFERRCVSIVTEQKIEGAVNRLLIAKGAPENILELSDFCETSGRVLPVDAEVRARCHATFQDLSRQGFRVLAVAYRDVVSQKAFSVADERSLILAGYLAFSDLPDPDAAASIAAMKRDGIAVKILPGDNELVAKHTCVQVGIERPVIVLGDELERTSDTALQHMVEEVTVFARVSPMQKHRITMHSSCAGMSSAI